MTQQEFFKRYTYSPSRDRIGGGGFGTVYKAYDNLLHREVAIKVSEVKTTADGTKTFSLKDEFEALAHVPKHPNIANYEEFYSFEMPNGIFDYAVMQYYPDGNLSNAIKIGLTAEQKEDVATQLLEGIDFLHKHKVVHRDLKPGNILIVKHGGRIIPLITDFGLSKATGMGENSMFSNSFGGGTPRYSSPEQLQGNPLRFNTDLWSYGAILYELFTGEQLFTAGSGAVNTAQADMEIYNKIVNGNVQSLGKMPEKWRKVAERCLVVDPTKRAKDAAGLFAIIKGKDDETEVTEGPSDPGRRPPLQRGTGGIPKTPVGSETPQTPRLGSSSCENGTPSPDPTDIPTNKKGLWIGLGIAAVFAILLFLLWPKSDLTSTVPDTQAYEACQTVADYRAYLTVYGRNALHHADAQAFIEQFVSDSVIRVQDSLTKLQAQQHAEADAKAQAEAEKKEEAAYKKCTTIAACDSYLKAYPKGKHFDEVKAKKAELEEKAQQETDRKEEASYDNCWSIAGCNNYLKSYPKGNYADIVIHRKSVLEEEESEANKKAVSIYFYRDSYQLPSRELYSRMRAIVNEAKVNSDHLRLRSSKRNCEASIAENRCNKIKVELMQMGFPENLIIIEDPYIGNKEEDNRVLIQRTFVIDEEMPSFPGGESKLMEYLSRHVNYPQEAREHGVQGKVFVNFTVEADGSITNVKLIRGIGSGCDEEAVRVVENMPKWNPGKQRGKPVKVSYAIPINFILQ